MPANFSLEDLPGRAGEAKKALSAYISQLEEAYVRRCEYRRREGIPVVAFNGYSRAGKDTAAEYITGLTNGRVKYPGSVSWRGMPIMAHMVGIAPEELYTVRHRHRDFLFQAFHAIRGEDLTFLARLCLGAGDVVVGIRGRLEHSAVLERGVVDYSLWIDNPRADKDFTVEYKRQACDLLVHNHGTLAQFHARLRRLLPLFYPEKGQEKENAKVPETAQADGLQPEGG